MGGKRKKSTALRVSATCVHRETGAQKDRRTEGQKDRTTSSQLMWRMENYPSL